MLIFQIEILVLMSYIYQLLFLAENLIKKTNFLIKKKLKNISLKNQFVQRNISLVNDESFFFFINIDRYKNDKFIYKN